MRGSAACSGTLEHWATISDITWQWSNAGLYTRRNTRNKYKMGEEWLENRPTEGDIRGAQYEPAECPGNQEDKSHPGVHQTQHSNLDEWVDYPTVFSIDVVSPGILRGTHSPRGIWRSMHPEEATNLVKEPERMSYEEQLRSSNLSSLKKRRLRGDIFALYSFLRRASGVRGAELFYLGCRDRMHGYGSKHIRRCLDLTFGSISLLRAR